MLSLSSILILFAQVATAGLGLLNILGFLQRRKEHPEKKYFYTVAVIAPILAHFGAGVIGIGTTFLFFLAGPTIPSYLVRYHAFAIEIANWVLWAVIAYIFTGKKSTWHVWVWAVIFWPSALIISTSPLIIVNNSGIIVPVNTSWQGALLAIQNVAFFIISFIYILCHRHKQKQQQKPIGYINAFFTTYLMFFITFTMFAAYTITNFKFPLLYVLAWFFGVIPIASFYLGMMALDDENSMLLIKPLLYITRSLKLKTIIILNTSVWITVITISLIISTLITNTTPLYENSPQFKQIAQEIGRMQAWFLLISILLLVLLTLLIVKFISNLLKPIEQLKKGVRTIGQGNFSHRIFDVSKDELGSLAMDFNDMAANLQRKTKKISRLQRIDTIKSQFIATASHALRTPLTSIRWSLAPFISDKATHPLNKEDQSLIGQAYESTNRMIDTVNNLLNASELESKTITLNKEDVSLVEIINEILQRLSYTIEGKKIQIVILWEPSNMSPSITADKNLIYIALENIITNAVIYNKKEGTVKIVGKVKKNAVIISISDTGIGISEEDAENIFSRFYRSKNASEIKTEGSGLGLYVAHAIISAHGGKIWFKNNSTLSDSFDTGTTFYIRLPKN